MRLRLAGGGVPGPVARSVAAAGDPLRRLPVLMLFYSTGGWGHYGVAEGTQVLHEGIINAACTEAFGNNTRSNVQVVNCNKPTQ